MENVAYKPHLSDEKKLNYPIHIIDDEASVRNACAFFVESLGYSYQLWSDARNFLAHVDLKSPGVALIDLRMPYISGEELCHQLNAKNSVIAQIIITGHGDIDTAVHLLKNGVIDFLQKPISADKLLLAIEVAIHFTCLKYRQQELMRIYEQLSPKKQQLFHLMAEGVTNKEIADELCISTRTVEVHRSEIMSKFSCTHITQFMSVYHEIKDITENRE
ncbi:Tetrathionate response regulatory protein TtrR [Pelistega indica]|uniref:Tetrathionate response regulatory protein TtrR n=1 Tax=Pelistega indica TaxID=1414851 RepID=V8G9A4_9BURK|nr:MULTISPECIES: response regulator [Pelistega]ETD73109.1 Tetrathionate response regulatory protein TtrR [Pelistega indica]